MPELDDAEDLEKLFSLGREAIWIRLGRYLNAYVDVLLLLYRMKPPLNFTDATAGKTYRLIVAVVSDLLR